MTSLSPAAERFREAMSRVAATVFVVTTDGPAGRHGATATSIASLTDEPPTLLVCLNVWSRAHKLALENRVLAVNTLSASDQALARAFSQPSGGVPDERFDHGEWHRLATGAPVLKGSVAAFDGRVVSATMVGTHSALFVEIDAIAFAEPSRDGLAYHRRTYKPFTAG
ncbi:flavin reductase [Chelatococcus sambhunathii]|nr:flavin reductase [Chelatococcus sambhunathii]